MGSGYLFPCSPEINLLVPLFPNNRKFVLLCSLFPNIVFVPLFQVSETLMRIAFLKYF